MATITIIIESIIIIVLIIWISVTIIAALTIIRKQKVKIKRHKAVNTYQHNHIVALSKVIADQKAEIDSYKFVCGVHEEIIEGLVTEIENKEEVIKQLIPEPDGV